MFLRKGRIIFQFILVMEKIGEILLKIQQSDNKTNSTFLFQNIMEDQASKKVFEQHLFKLNLKDHHDFWKEIQEYKVMWISQTNTNKDKINKIINIYQTFVIFGEDSMHTLIPESLSEKYGEIILSKFRPTLHFFKESEKYLENEMMEVIEEIKSLLPREKYKFDPKLFCKKKLNFEDKEEKKKKQNSKKVRATFKINKNDPLYLQINQKQDPFKKEVQPSTSREDENNKIENNTDWTEKNFYLRDEMDSNNSSQESLIFNSHFNEISSNENSLENSSRDSTDYSLHSNEQKIDSIDGHFDPKIDWRREEELSESPTNDFSIQIENNFDPKNQIFGNHVSDSFLYSSIKLDPKRMSENEKKQNFFSILRNKAPPKPSPSPLLNENLVIENESEGSLFKRGFSSVGEKILFLLLLFFE